MAHGWKAKTRYFHPWQIEISFTQAKSKMFLKLLLTRWSYQSTAAIWFSKFQASIFNNVFSCSGRPGLKSAFGGKILILGNHEEDVVAMNMDAFDVLFVNGFPGTHYLNISDGFVCFNQLRYFLFDWGEPTDSSNGLNFHQII